MQLDSRGDRAGLSWWYESLEPPPLNLLFSQVCVLSTCCIVLSRLVSHLVLLSLSHYLFSFFLLFNQLIAFHYILRLFPLFLNVVFCSHLSSCFSFLFLSLCLCGLHLWSSHWSREKHGKEWMLILSAQWRVQKGERENVTRLRKWDGHCAV